MSEDEISDEAVAEVLEVFFRDMDRRISGDHPHAFKPDDPRLETVKEVRDALAEAAKENPRKLASIILQDLGRIGREKGWL